MGIGPCGFSVPEQLQALPELISHSFFLQAVAFHRHFLVSIKPCWFSFHVFPMLLTGFRTRCLDEALATFLKSAGWPGWRTLSPECCSVDEDTGFQVMRASRVCFVPEYDWRAVYLDLDWEGHYNLC
jgi:hypothetical protein